MNRDRFKFGLESEYMLINAETHKPKWYHDLDFSLADSL